MGKTLQVRAKVLSNKNIKSNYWHMCLDTGKVSLFCLPGQFISIKLGDNSQFLLRRPFGIHKACGNSIEILYEVLGEGTRILSGEKSGDILDIIGPLGNGFAYPRLPLASPQGEQAGVIRYPLILVAGGMGVAPLVFLAERLAYSVERRACRKNKRLKLSATVLIGSRVKEGILCEKEFKNLGYDVKITTDDGSVGFKGRVTELLENLLNAKRSTLNAIIYACGPKPMLREVARVCSQSKISAQLSLEAHMACGIGVCLGCVINTSDGFKRVCKDGPVFKAQEIIW